MYLLLEDGWKFFEVAHLDSPLIWIIRSVIGWLHRPSRFVDFTLTRMPFYRLLSAYALHASAPASNLVVTCVIGGRLVVFQTRIDSTVFVF